MRKILIALGLTLGLTAHAGAQTQKLTVATYAPPGHSMSKWLETWASNLEEKSGGRLDIEILHGAQMGPPPAYFDIAANGRADITWILHGATPGRFPLTEISNLPFVFCSAEQATQVLNDADLRAKYLDHEHKGVKVLLTFMHPPGQIAMKGKAVLSVADFAGKALRPPSQVVGQLIAQLGGRPVGLPPTAMAESLEKGTIDGTMIDYGGAAFAFQLGPFLTDITEVHAYAASFALVMNPDSHARLPEDLRTMVDESVDGVASEVGQVWDTLDDAGKKALMGAGAKIHQMPEAEYAKLKAAGDSLTESYVRDLDGKGLPASEVLQAIRDAADRVGKVGPGCQ